jgi:hypothetical protein
MIKEQQGMKGRVTIEMLRADGTRERDEFDNLIVTAGKNHVAARVGSSPPTGMNSIAVGTGTNSPAAGDTALQTELYRESCTVTPSNNTVVYSTVFAAGEATGALTEAGIFNQNTIGGTMLARVAFTVKNKAAGDSMTITWTITFN